MPRATAMHAAAVAKKRECKNCSMRRILFSHDTSEKADATARKSIAAGQNPRNERRVGSGGMRACSYSSTVTASSLDSAARSPPSVMTLASDIDCDSGGSEKRAWSYSDSLGGETYELDQNPLEPAGDPQPSKEIDHAAFYDEVADAMYNGLLLEEEEEEDDDFHYISDEQTEEWCEPDFTPLELCFMKETDDRAKASLLHIHHTELSLTERSVEWHSLDDQERQWNRIERMFTIHESSASPTPHEPYLLTERQCKAFLGHAPGSLACTAVTYSGLVQQVSSIVTAVERSKIKVSDAVQMMRDRMMDLSATRNFKSDFPVPDDNDDKNNARFFADMFLNWARAAGFLAHSETAASLAPKRRANEAEDELGDGNLQFGHGVSGLIANHILRKVDPARYGDSLESEQAVCYIPSDSQGEQVRL